jgi:N utilization substance protein B
MSSRHLGRVIALQVLYQCSSRKTDSIDDICDPYINTLTYDDVTKKWGHDLSYAIYAELNKLDTLIEEYSIGWSIQRINPVDLSILRIAFYELSFTDLSPNIVLNEAIELSKKFSSDESPKFINGILGKYVENHVHRAD